MTAFRGPSVPGAGRGKSQAANPAAQMRVVVPFEDNRHLPRLLGEHDAHLALIEDRLGIDAQAHGNVVVLTGAGPECEVARSVLEQAYTRIGKGEEIGPGDIDGLIRHARQAETAAAGQAHIGTRRKVVKARTLAQSTYIRALEKTDLVFGIGPAGTGKTYLAMAQAVSYLLAKKVSRIVLARPAVEAGEKLGFLPGDLQEKVNPYLRPLYDALYDMLDVEKADRLLERGTIEVAPLAFMRGRTLNDAFVILDEAQNTTSEQMKMFLTRLGLGSKAVVTGDVTQIDLPIGRMSGLVQAMEVVGKVDGISFIYFDERDVVRHKLVQAIVKAYDAYGSGPSAR